MVEGGGHRQDEGVFLLLQAGVTTQPGQEAVGRVCAWTWERVRDVRPHGLLWGLARRQNDWAVETEGVSKRRDCPDALGPRGACLWVSSQGWGQLRGRPWHRGQARWALVTHLSWAQRRESCWGSACPRRARSGGRWSLPPGQPEAEGHGRSQSR